MRNYPVSLALCAALVSLGNEADPSFSMAGFANAAEISEDGTTLIPYGNWPHVEGIQRFGLEQAQAIVARFKSTWGTFKRAVIGLPIFNGHPDMPGLANEYPDKAEYGQIADLEAKPEGLAFRLILSHAGAALVASGKKYISPHWLANAVGKQGSRTIYEPALLKSVGLTSRPNIPNKSLVNTASMNPKLLALLIKLLNLKPLANATAVTEAQATEAIEALPADFSPIAPEALANEQRERGLLATRATNAEAEVARLKGLVDANATALANERKAKITVALDAAVKAGRITAAQRPTWQKLFDSNFEDATAALSNTAPTVKTTPTAEQKRLAALDRTLQSGASGAAIANEGENIGDLVNAELTSMGCSDPASRSKNYNKAFANVKRKKPALFTPAEAVAAGDPDRAV